MAEQAGGGRGDARSNPAAGKAPLARRPRARFAAVLPGGFGTALGALRPLCEVLADGPVHHGTRKRGPELSRTERIWREPQQSVERRAGPRHGLVISGDPEMGSTARRATGCGGFRTSACRRSAPPTEIALILLECSSRAICGSQHRLPIGSSLALASRPLGWPLPASAPQATPARLTGLRWRAERDPRVVYARAKIG